MQDKVCGRCSLSIISCMAYVTDIARPCSSLTQQPHTDLRQRALDLARSDRFFRTTDCRRGINCCKIENIQQITTLTSHTSMTRSILHIHGQAYESLNRRHIDNHSRPTVNEHHVRNFTTNHFTNIYRTRMCGSMPNVIATLPNIGGPLFNAAKFG